MTVTQLSKRDFVTCTLSPLDTFHSLPASSSGSMVLLSGHELGSSRVLASNQAAPLPFLCGLVKPVSKPQFPYL